MASELMSELFSAFEDVYHSRFLACVGLTLAIYDWALVFPDELETIIRARWTVPKVLYYYASYYAHINYRIYDRPSPTVCVFWVMAAVLGMLTTTCAANCLLALRLMALYRRKKAVVWFIRCFFAVSYGATFAIAIQALVIYYDSLFYFELLGVCGTRQSSKSFPAVFYGPAAFEFFVFALTAWRGLKDAKIITGTGSAPFLVVLYRDGFICFFVMIALRAWNIKIYLTQPLSSFSLGTQLMWSVNTILTTRVYMNLVWLAKKPVIETINIGSRVPAGTGIPLRVHTFTEVHTDDWKPKRRDIMLDTVDYTFDQRRF